MVEICNDCNGKVINKNNEVYCIKCGLILDDTPINFGKDTINIEGDINKNSRSGPPITWLNPFGITHINNKRRK